MQIYTFQFLEKKMDKKSLDPITTEIIQSSLQAACDEMFIAMRKTAMSSIIYEVLDFGTAVTDAKGNIAASGAGIPAFIAACRAGAWPTPAWSTFPISV